MRNCFRLPLASLVAAALVGCADLPDYKASGRSIEALALPGLTVPANASGEWPVDSWWRAYGDAQLDALIERALAESPSLAAANARLAQAQAVAGIARGNAAPQVTGEANAGYGRQSENYLIPRPPLGKGGEYVSQGVATLNFAYDLDFWGRNAALVRSAESQATAAALDQAAARLALTTGIVRAYAQLASQYELLDIAEATLKQRVAIADLTQKRVAAGLDTSLEIRQAETGTASLRAEQVQLEAALAATRLQLVALAGGLPDEAARITRPRITTPPFNLPSDLALDLLGRRPEIAAQRARIAAFREELAAAKAQFYPNISLTALIGYQAIGLDQLFSGGSLTNNIGPAIHLPIFQGGRLRANYAARRAEVEAAVAQYNQSVLAAAQEAVEYLTRGAALDREAAATAEALDAAQEAYRIALLRYREGLSSYLNVLAVENQLLVQRRALAELKARRLDLQIGLVRALGGGFTAQAPASQNLAQEKP